MKERNTIMGEVFRENSKSTEPKVIVLNGAKHLRPLPSGGIYEHTIQQKCGIPFQQVIDLTSIGN